MNSNNNNNNHISHHPHISSSYSQTTAPAKIPIAVSVPSHLHRSTNSTASYAAPESGSLLARAEERKAHSLPSVAPYLVLFTNSIVPLRLSEAVKGVKTNNDGTTGISKQELEEGVVEDPRKVACVLPIRGKTLFFFFFLYWCRT